MPDLLPPRLLARVERSLRKRISADIHPHLLRCASHARSVDEFMAAAARLLLDPRERAQWLASWRRRAPHPGEEAAFVADAADSRPALLDTTRPATLDPWDDRRFEIPSSQLVAIRGALVRELGPTGGLLVDSESRQSGSTGELMSRLQQHLPDEHVRLRFVMNAGLPPGGEAGA